MRWSQAFIPTLREDPADAEAVSHKLLVRGGFIRQLMAGSYSLLPLGKRVAAKVERIIREEMNAIGGQEFLAPVVHPGELWKRTGRFDGIDEQIKLVDRRQVDLVLALTHEEVFALLAGELNSYRQLPQLWYHIQTKYRDEPRPKGGLLRVREFTMKDSYSLDIDRAGLDRQFDAHHGAYLTIFERLGLKAIAVEASSGVMGGSESVEFMVESPAGEDDIAICPACGYAANLEKAASALAEIVDEVWTGAPERVPTPGIRTIAELAESLEFAPAHRQIKTLVYIAHGEPILVLVRGDHQVQEQKLIDGLATGDVRPAHPEEILELMGANAGSLGAVGVSGPRIVADLALAGRSNMTTGANTDDWHLRGVDVERDICVDRWLDLRTVVAGEACVQCGGDLAVKRVIEIGHIFKLGTKYTDALGVSVLDESGGERAVIMGSYGIGVGRNVAAVIEANHDDKGIVWPMSVAPYEVVVTVVKPLDPSTAEAGERIYRDLLARGVDVIVDDRDERPGVKFADAELIGVPYRVTVGPRGLASGEVEIQRRRDGRTESVALEAVVDRVVEAVEAERG